MRWSGVRAPRASSGLRNDDEAETFPVRHRVGTTVFPCQYVKIVPLLAWGANFNYSIWYILLRGIADAAFVRTGTPTAVPAPRFPVRAAGRSALADAARLGAAGRSAFSPGRLHRLSRA